MREFIATPLAKEILRVILALLGMFVGMRLVRVFIKRIPQTSMGKRLEPSALSFLMSFCSIALQLLLVCTAAAVMGIPTSSIVAALGSIGLAIGLALQGSLANLAGGLMILVFKPFKLGDWVEESGGQSGRVEDISIFYTTLRAADGRKIVLPNGSLSNGRVINYSDAPMLRLDLTYSAAYDSDVQRVTELLLAAAKECPLLDQVNAAHAPMAFLARMEDSALVFVLRAWCSFENYYLVAGDMNPRVKKAFDDAGITIPYPQMDVHLENKR